MRSEALSLPTLLASLTRLDPALDRIIAVDGGSTDGSVGLAASAGLKVVHCPRPGRAAGINDGVAQISAPIVCILHADTLLPKDAIAVIQSTLAERSVVLAGFTTLLRGRERVLWGTSFHNWIKT